LEHLSDIGSKMYLSECSFSRVEEGLNKVEQFLLRPHNIVQ